MEEKKMKKILSTVLAASFAAAALSIPAAASAANYTDVPEGAWYEGYLDKLSDLGGINGYEDGTFRPDDTVTVAEFSKALISLVDGEQPAEPDAPWYWGYRGYIENRGLGTGLIHEWNIPITRVCAAGLISNTLSIISGETLPIPYDTSWETVTEALKASGQITDFQRTKEPYWFITQRGELNCYMTGIITGYEDGSFRPEGNMTRAEMCAVLVRALDKSEREPVDLTNAPIPTPTPTPKPQNDDCIVEGTLVTLADGTKKPVEEITYDDELLARDLFTGEYTAAKPEVIADHGRKSYEVVTLEFSDDTEIGIITSHAFYSPDENRFINMHKDNAADYIGYRFIKTDGESNTEVTLTGCRVDTEYTGCYSLVTTKCMNFVAEDLLNLTGSPFEGWIDYAAITPDIKYDADELAENVRKYGLFTYDEFKDQITEEIFDGINGPYFKILLGKGIATPEMLSEKIFEYLVDNGIVEK